jgi:hypothetical protein
MRIWHQCPRATLTTARRLRRTMRRLLRIMGRNGGVIHGPRTMIAGTRMIVRPPMIAAIRMTARRVVATTTRTTVRVAMAAITATTTMKIRTTASQWFTRSSHRLLCRNIRSRKSRAMDICGPRDTGATLRRDITGCRGRGRVRRKLDICGRRLTGDIRADDIASTTGIGARTSGTTAELTMGTVTPAPGIRVGTGRVTGSTTTAR